MGSGSSSSDWRDTSRDNSRDSGSRDSGSSGDGSGPASSSRKSSGYDWSEKATASGGKKKTAEDYAKDDDRVYTGFSAQGLPPPVGMNISTKSPLALVLLVDVTGSMKYIPEDLFKKIPALYNEPNTVLQGVTLKERQDGKTIEDLLEIAVVAVGDAHTDKYPLQVVDFSKGATLIKGVNTIKPEGGGGPPIRESYELAGYFLLNHCSTPGVPAGQKPLLIIVGDESFYNTVRADLVQKLIGDSLPASLDSAEMFRALANKFEAFILRPELSYSASDYAKVHAQWASVLPPQNVLLLEDPKRLVDCVVGLCGAVSDNYAESINMLKRRQRDENGRIEQEKIDSVMRTLQPLIDAKAARAV